MSKQWLIPSEDGDHRFARCLLLRVRGRSKCWVFRYQAASGRRREMGLGGAITESEHAFERQRHLMTEEAAALRLKVANGIDPLEDRQRARDEAKVARLQANGMTVRRALRVWADTVEREKDWTTRYARDVAYAIENHPPAWLLEIPMVDLRASHVVQALAEMPFKQDQKDNLRQRLDWAMELFMKSEDVDANPAGVRRIVRGKV